MVVKAPALTASGLRCSKLTQAGSSILGQNKALLATAGGALFVLGGALASVPLRARLLYSGPGCTAPGRMEMRQRHQAGVRAIVLFGCWAGLLLLSALGVPSPASAEQGLPPVESLPSKHKDAPSQPPASSGDELTPGDAAPPGDAAAPAPGPTSAQPSESEPAADEPSTPEQEGAPDAERTDAPDSSPQGFPTKSKPETNQSASPAEGKLVPTVDLAALDPAELISRAEQVERELATYEKQLDVPPAVSELRTTLREQEHQLVQAVDRARHQIAEDTAGSSSRMFALNCIRD